MCCTDIVVWVHLEVLDMQDCKPLEQTVLARYVATISYTSRYDPELQGTGRQRDLDIHGTHILLKHTPQATVCLRVLMTMSFYISGRLSKII